MDVSMGRDWLLLYSGRMRLRATGFVLPRRSPDDRKRETAGGDFRTFNLTTCCASQSYLEGFWTILKNNVAVQHVASSEQAQVLQTIHILLQSTPKESWQHEENV